MIKKQLKKLMPVHQRLHARHQLDELLRKLDVWVLRAILTPIETMTGKYITIHTRPKYAKDVQLVSDAAERDYSDFAIVMQGPLPRKKRFVVETMMLYKKNFPGAKLIVSTWEDQDQWTIRELRRIGVEVLLSKILKNGGPQNINRQLYSSRVGMARARELGVTYALKTRADARMYNPRLLLLLSNILTIFPPAPSKAKGRIIGISGFMNRKKLYLFNDIFYFGYIEDMERLFNIPLVEDPNIKLPFYESWRPFTNEAYICWQYALALDYPTATTWDEYYSLLARQFFVIDVSSLDLYYLRHNRFRERQLEVEYGPAKDRNLNFGFWLELYAKYKDSAHP